MKITRKDATTVRLWMSNAIQKAKLDEKLSLEEQANLWGWIVQEIDDALEKDHQRHVRNRRIIISLLISGLSLLVAGAHMMLTVRQWIS